jgi:hypothetical protein
LINNQLTLKQHFMTVITIKKVNGGYILDANEDGNYETAVAGTPKEACETALLNILPKEEGSSITIKVEY